MYCYCVTFQMGLSNDQSFHSTPLLLQARGILSSISIQPEPVLGLTYPKTRECVPDPVGLFPLNS